MFVTKRARRRLRLTSMVFVLLVLTGISLLAWLSLRYQVSADWTSDGRHTLSEASLRLLAKLEGPVEITSYAREDDELRGRITSLVDRYRRVNADINVEFVNPDVVPDQLRELGINRDGELVVRYQGTSKHVQIHSERALTNALSSLVRGRERWIVFLSGHGERDPFGKANHDLQDWTRQLSNRGFKPQVINLAEIPATPDNTSVLVIASPQVNLLPGEVALINDYLRGGGNLLWLADPGSLVGLEPLAETLAVELRSGTMVDPNTQLFGISHPAMVVVKDYSEHPATQDFRYVTVFPFARPVGAKAGGDWRVESLLTTGKRSWSETGALQGEIAFDESVDLRGPLDIGIALTRTLSSNKNGDEEAKQERQQRVVILGDGDFISNAYLGNSGNLDLGSKIVDWLAGDDELVTIPVKVTRDLSLDLSTPVSAAIGLGFLLVLPLLLGGTGLVVWLRRRKR